MLASLLKTLEDERPAAPDRSQGDPGAPAPADPHSHAALLALTASRKRLHAMLQDIDATRTSVLVKSALRRLPVKGLRGELKLLGVRAVPSKEVAVDKLLRLLRPVMSEDEMKGVLSICVCVCVLCETLRNDTLFEEEKCSFME